MMMMTRRRALSTLALVTSLTAAPAAAQGSGAVAAAAPSSTRPSLAAVPAPRVFHHHADIWTGFHDASGFGDVELRPMPIADAPIPLRMAAIYVFKGRRPTAPPPWVSIAFVANDSVARFAAGSRAVRLTPAEGAPVTIREKEVAHTFGPAGAGKEERVAFRMLTSDFLRLVGARSLAVRVGATTEVALSEESLEALRDFASRMRPSTFDSTRAAASADVATGPFRLRKDVYEARDVDTPAKPSLLGVLPPFPAAIVGADRVRRQVLVEYVVDTTGTPDPASLRGRFPERDSLFVEALRPALAQWRFTPATKAGHPVAQIVRQAVTFEP
jgi:hypothetical protein